MRLNLANKNNSDIDYTVIKYPDGQQDITINKLSTTSVVIWSRFNNWKDLELIVCSAKLLKRKGAQSISLFIPYILGARSDRQFSSSGNSYLVDVIAPVINSLNFERVMTMDAHSDVAAACIKNLWDDTNVTFCDNVLNLFDENYTLVSPDAGSLKKIYPVAQKSNYTGEILVCSKKREVSTGIITETIVPPHNPTQSYIIIDDICDGGRTFIEIAKKLKDVNPDCVVYLIVTHGIFSAGFDELKKYFAKIFCTNSYSDIQSEILNQTNIF